MALSDWFKRPSPLQLALQRGLEPKGRLKTELTHLGDYSLESSRDAKAVCDALARLSNDSLAGDFDDNFGALARLFQEVKGADCDAFQVMLDLGIPTLCAIVRRNLRSEWARDSGEILFALKMMAAYPSEEGARTLIEAARVPIQPDGYLWHVAFDAFSQEHPYAELVFNELSRPLPEGFIAVSMLDAANQKILKGWQGQHPFDNDEGVFRLERWLTSVNPAEVSYAVSAAVGAVLLKHASRERLLGIASQHANRDVRVEAAWGVAKLGDEEGIRTLSHLCREVNFSTTARRYLAELGREDAIPELSADFMALAEFAGWLAHPNELDRAPDEIAIMDHRDLWWPSTKERIPVWLVRYRAKSNHELEPDDEGVGMVGSVTFCMFGEELSQRPAEDIYAIHCCWELDDELLKGSDVDEDSDEYASLLQQWTQEPLINARVEHVTEIDPQLGYPRRLVAVASAVRGSEKGWAVLDGERTRWYSSAEMPPQTRSTTVLRIHLGRRLLGFDEEPDRKALLVPKRQTDPNRVIAVYENWLIEARIGSEQRRTELLSSHSDLGNYFEQYMNAVLASRGGDRQSLLVDLYQAVLNAVDDAVFLDREEALGVCGVLSSQFSDYANALVSMGRHDEVRKVIAQFLPYWQHNLGYGLLGNAGFNIGEWTMAEELFAKLREGMDEWQCCEEMSKLARIWHRNGKVAEAKRLLMDAIRGVALLKAKAKHASDRKMYLTAEQTHRQTFLELFPGDACELDGLEP